MKMKTKTISSAGRSYASPLIATQLIGSDVLCASTPVTSYYNQMTDLQVNDYANIGWEN